MSAPTDRQDPNDPSFYAPKGPRAARLGQVSDAAAALLAQAPDDERVAISSGESLESDDPIGRLRARHTLDPEVLPAPPVPLRGGTWAATIARFIGVVAAAAVIALIIVAQMSSTDSSRQPAAARPMELASVSTRAVPTIAVKRTEPIIPQLVVQNLQGKTGEPAPLGVSLQGDADGAAVMITGLPAGTTLSTGTSIGADAWQVSAAELANAWIMPPADFVGAADLMAELRIGDNAVGQRRQIHLEWIGPRPAVAAPRQLDREEIALLVKRGRDFIAAGDLAAARLVLQRAAEARDAEAALSLAATYDPTVLRQLKVYGIAGDVDQARAWYQKAQEFGSPEAPRRLEMLASGSR